MRLNKIQNVQLKTVALLALVLLLSACVSKPELPPEKTDKSSEEEDSFVSEQYQKGLDLQVAGDYESAISIYKTLYLAHPEYLGPIINLGIIALKQERFEQAARLFAYVIERDPKHKQVLNYLGILARKNGDFEQAETYYRQALEVDPFFADAARNLAILLDLYRGRFEEALFMYEHYQSLLSEPDPQVKEWIFDTKNRLQRQ